MVGKPLKKALDISEKVIRHVEEGQSEDAPIELPGTFRERGRDDPQRVVDKRTGKVEKRDKDPENLVDRD